MLKTIVLLKKASFEVLNAFLKTTKTTLGTALASLLSSAFSPTRLGSDSHCLYSKQGASLSSLLFQGFLVPKKGFL